MIKKPQDHMIGQKNGLLTVRSFFREKGRIYFICECDCGNGKIIEKANFRKAHMVSCGCNKGKRYWIDYDFKHPLYSVWMGIKMRCYNKNEPAYKNYGARGVVMCEEWLNNAKLFIDWALENGWEKGKFIDKDIKNPNAMEYSPENCSIVTRAQNNRARRCVKIKQEYVQEIRDSKLTARDLAKIYGVSISTIYSIKYKLTWKN